MAAEDNAEVIAMRQVISDALARVAGDLSKLNQQALTATGSSGGISRLDGLFGGFATRLLGPVGVAAGLWQVASALENVATKSIQMQAFARNSNMAVDQVKDLQYQMKLMGISSQESLGVIGNLNNKLNELRAMRQGSSIYQSFLPSTGGAEFMNQVMKLEDAGKRVEAVKLIFDKFNQQDERGKIFMAGQFGMTVDMMERLRINLVEVSGGYKASREELEKYAAAGAKFEKDWGDIWEAVAGNTIVNLNKITGATKDNADTMKTIITGLNAFVDEGFARANTTVKEFMAIKAFFEKFANTGQLGSDNPMDNPAATQNGKEAPYPQGEDPMGRDYTRRQFRSQEYWRGVGRVGADGRGGTSDATDFSGMRRAQSVQEEQTNILEEIRDTLQGKIPTTGGSGGGSGSGGSGGGSSRGGFDLGGMNGKFGGTGGGDYAASRGATGANTQTAMNAAMDQLRKEGVPEANLKHAAAMLVGQAQAESGLNPNTSHDNGTGYGIYGARNERATKMLSWMKDNGYANNSLEGQIRYMAHEAMTGKDYAASRSALMGASDETMASGTRTLTNNFERPARDNSPVRLGHARAALAGGVSPAPGAGDEKSVFGGTVNEMQSRVAGIRRGAITPQLRTALDYASSRTGLSATVVSGGQRMEGAPGHTGSHRHDGGRAADFTLRDADGNVVSPNDPRAQEFYRYAGQAGVTGGGHSYGDMGKNIHLDTAGSIYAGGKAFRDAVTRGQNEQDEFRRALRERMDAQASKNAASGSVSAKVEFQNVPPNVKTSVESEGDVFKDLQISKSKQGEVAGGSPGQPFAGVW